MICEKCGKELNGNNKCIKCDDITEGVISLVVSCAGFATGMYIICGIIALYFGNKSKDTKGYDYGKWGYIIGLIETILGASGLLFMILISIISFIFLIFYYLFFFIVSGLYFL